MWMCCSICIVIQLASNGPWQRYYLLVLFSFWLRAWLKTKGRVLRGLYLTYLQARTVFVSLAQRCLPLGWHLASQCRNGSHFHNTPPVSHHQLSFPHWLYPLHPMPSVGQASLLPAQVLILHMQRVKWLWHSQGMNMHHHSSAVQWTWNADWGWAGSARLASRGLELHKNAAAQPPPVRDSV